MNSILQVNKQDVVFEVFDEEIIIIHLGSGNYYSYGGTGTVIWKMLEIGITFEDMQNRIKNQYNGDSQEMAHILKESINELEKEGLIVRKADKSDLNETNPAPLVVPKTEGNKPVFQTPKLEKHDDMQDFLLVDPIHDIDYSESPKKEN